MVKQVKKRMLNIKDLKYSYTARNQLDSMSMCFNLQVNQGEILSVIGHEISHLKRNSRSDRSCLREVKGDEVNVVLSAWG